MKALSFAAPLLFALGAHAAGFELAGERVRFDQNSKPIFSTRQIGSTAPATRAGFERWASTARGRQLVRRFDRNEYSIQIFEQTIDGGSGEAPPPGIATMMAADDRTKVKTYVLILNPTFAPPMNTTLIFNDPSTPADVMAVTWAAEMLHIDFYSRGITLPPHSRGDFQSEWREIAAQLGFPELKHGDDEDIGYRRRPRVIFWR